MRLSPPLRVEVVSSADRLGDAETSLLDLLDRADGRLAPSVVVRSGGALRGPATERRWPVTEVRGGRGPLAALRAAWSLRARWRDDPPDVVLAIDDGAVAVAVPAGCAAPARVLLRPHPGTRAGRVGRLLRWLGDGVLPAEDADGAGDARFVARLTDAAARPGAGAASGPPVSVVVPLHDEELAVDDLVAALGRQLRDDDELVLVDDGSTDATPIRLEAARRAGHVAVCLPTNGGAAIARNHGVRAARHDVIVCTDAGCEPTSGWLDAMRAAFTEEPAPALVNGVYRVRTDSVLERAAEVACYPDVEEARRAGLLTRAYGRLLGRRFEAHTPNGRSLAFSRAAWQHVGGFPEDLRTAEDVRFGTDIVAAGLPALLNADAEVTWAQRPTLRATARMYYRYGLGDAAAGDTRMIVRNLVRGAGYVAGPLLVVFGGWLGTAVVALGAAAYLWLPVARVARRHLAPATLIGIPLALAVKDGAKAAGCVHGLMGARP